MGIDRTSILRRKKLEVFDSCMAALEYDGVVNGMAVYSEHPPERDSGNCRKLG